MTRAARTTLLAGLILLLVAPAHALAAGWTTPTALTPTATPAAGQTLATENAQLVVNASGAQALLWEDWNNGGDTDGCIKGEATTRLPGSDWAPTSDVGCKARIQIGPDGTAVAAWEDAN